MPVARCLILACGNTLREDDGVGPWLAAWAQQRFSGDARVCVLASHQWTPELAQDLSEAQTALFIDCATNQTPGEVRVAPIHAAETDAAGIGTHHLGAPQLLALCAELYGIVPRSSLLLTVGAGSLELREGFSDVVQNALPPACAQLEKAVLGLIAPPSAHTPPA